MEPQFIERLRVAALSEVDYLKVFGMQRDLIPATSNLGGCEAVLPLIASEEAGIAFQARISGA